jgi:serine/threonine protein kinase
MRYFQPENLMICYVGHIPLVKVADFGLAEILAETEPPISGEADFVAPELVGYTSRFSQSADIWSLGEILYYMMFKELPFR